MGGSMATKHYCEEPHYKDIPVREGGTFYGSAVSRCTEDDRGYFWVDNDEYISYVLYCPFCGVKGREYAA